MLSESDGAEPDRAASSSGDNKRRQYGKGGRRGGGNNHKTRSNGSTKFEERESSLQGHVYDLSSAGQNSDQFIRTTKEIETYVGRTSTEYTGMLEDTA